MGISCDARSGSVQRSSAIASDSLGTVAFWQRWHLKCTRAGTGAPSWWPAGAPVVVTICGRCLGWHSGTEAGAGRAVCMASPPNTGCRRPARLVGVAVGVGLADLHQAKRHDDGCHNAAIQDWVTPYVAP